MKLEENSFITLNYKNHSKVDLQWYFIKDLTILSLKNKSTMSETQQIRVFLGGWSTINTGAKNVICWVFLYGPPLGKKSALY